MWQVIDESLRVKKPSEEKVWEARDEIVNMAERLMRGSRVTLPAAAGDESALLTGT